MAPATQAARPLFTCIMGAVSLLSSQTSCQVSEDNVCWLLPEQYLREVYSPENRDSWGGCRQVWCCCLSPEFGAWQVYVVGTWTAAQEDACSGSLSFLLPPGGGVPSRAPCKQWTQRTCRCGPWPEASQQKPGCEGAVCPRAAARSRSWPQAPARVTSCSAFPTQQP